MCEYLVTGAQIGNQESLDTVATLLCLDSYRMGDALTKKFMVLRGEEITTPLTKEQVCVCVCVISLVYLWIVATWRIC